MNYGIIRYILGMTMILEGALMAPSCLVAVIYGEKRAFFALLVTVLLCLGIGHLLRRKKPVNKEFFTKEGFVTVALCWIVISIMGGLPFLFSGAIKNPVDALFEAVSGFTTTGASILTDVEVLPKGILFWRSFTHWIGGMGVLVFLLALLPMNGGFHMSLMKAESPGPSVGRLLPKVQNTAKVLYSIYLVMTIVEIVILVVSGMPLFDALTLSFGTAGTGGFGIRNDSIASYTVFQQVVITIFMILFGINFNAYYLILLGKFREAFRVEEVRGYLLIIAIAILIITGNIAHLYGSVGEALQQAAFQVGSIITTTGYATTNFDLWPEVSRTVLVLLMFVGACSGSTGGGIKVSRLIILLKTVGKEINQYQHPNSVRKIKMDGKCVEHEVVRATNVFMVVYVLIFAFSMLVLAFDNLDLITNFTAVTATLNNIGPGLEMVGPSANFSIFNCVGKLVLIFDMLAGRLELFPLLLLFSKGTWKRF